MPSDAYINFLHIRIDVIKLIGTHSFYLKNKPNDKSLGFLARSAILMLCAAWERYNEDLLLESIQIITSSLNDIQSLNNQIKKTISSKVVLDKNEIKPIQLAGDGWKNVWLSYATEETKVFNTPKSIKLNTLFKSYLGIDEYTNYWKVGEFRKVDLFVSIRGDIAHNGNKAKNVTMKKVRDYQDLIISNIIEIDSRMATELQSMSTLPNLPWSQDYFRDLNKY